MSFLKKLFQPNPELDLEKGQEAFSKKQYNAALKSFQKAQKHFKKQGTLENQIICLDNAALSAEKAEKYDISLKLYYDLLDTRLQSKFTVKEILKDLDRGLLMARLSENPPISSFKFEYMKFLIHLANKDFKLLSTMYNKLKFESEDEYSNFIQISWNLIHSKDTFLDKKSLPRTGFPLGFEPIIKAAELVMQRCSLCEVEISLTDPDMKDQIQKGDEFSLFAKLTAHAPISISTLNLKTTNFRLISSTMPELPLKMSTGENYTGIFTLIPNLPGKWEIGPVNLQYIIPSEEGDYPGISNVLSINVREATPALKIIMESDAIEEDFEYLVTIQAENIGKVALQNIEIKVDIPDEVELYEGTSEKFISTLVEGETINFSIRVRFNLEKTHFEGHILRAEGSIDNNQIRLAKSSIKLGGNRTE